MRGVGEYRPDASEGFTRAEGISLHLVRKEHTDGPPKAGRVNMRADFLMLRRQTAQPPPAPPFERGGDSLATVIRLGHAVRCRCPRIVRPPNSRSWRIGDDASAWLAGQQGDVDRP